MVTEAQQKKVGKVLGEFKAGQLKSSTGATVTSEDQAVAIALSEASLARKRSPPVVDLDAEATMDKLMDWNMHQQMISDNSVNSPALTPQRERQPRNQVVPSIMQQIQGTPARAAGPDINSVMRNARKE